MTCRLKLSFFFNFRTIEAILLDRARGFTCSKFDPVTGGVHCAIGGGAYDFVVTSTLASQCPPAVGRAMAMGLVKNLQIEDSIFHPNSTSKYALGDCKVPLSYVSLGDGSVNNAHFLSAHNMVFQQLLSDMLYI